MFFCHQCAHEDLSPSCLVLLPPTCLKLFWLCNLQLRFLPCTLYHGPKTVTWMLEKSGENGCNLHTLSCLSCTQVLTPPSIEDVPGRVWWRLAEHWVSRSVLASGTQCPPPCRPQGAAPRSHCDFFHSSISLILSKAALQKLLTVPCLSFPSLPLRKPGFPNSFSNDSQLE